jgi:hypothetical protein
MTYLFLNAFAKIVSEFIKKMPQIVDFTLVFHGDPVHFSQAVRKALSNSWQLYGSPYLDGNGNHTIAMIKTKEPETFPQKAYEDFSLSRSMFPVPELEA